MARQDRYTSIAQRIAKPLLSVRVLRMHGGGLLMDATSTGIREDQIVRPFPLYLFLDCGHYVFRHRHITPFPCLWLRFDQFPARANPVAPNPQSSFVDGNVFYAKCGGLSPSQPAKPERQDQYPVAAGRFGKGHQLLGR